MYTHLIGNKHRQDAIATGLESWEALNQAAAASIERCIRVCKFKVAKPMEPALKCAHIVPASFEEKVLDLPLVNVHNVLTGDYTTTIPDDESEERAQLSPGHMLVQALLDNISSGGVDVENAVRSLRLVHSNFSVHRLPSIVRSYQQDVLNALHSACSARREAAHKISFCLVCAINGKGFQSKLRMCSILGVLSCITCQPGKTLLVVTCSHISFINTQKK